MKKLLSLALVATSAIAVMAGNQVSLSSAHQAVKAPSTTAYMGKANNAQRYATKLNGFKSPIKRALTDDIDTLYLGPAGAFWVNRPLVGNSFSGYYGMLLPDGEVTWKNSSTGTDESTLVSWRYVDATTDGYYASADGETLTTTIKGDIQYVYPAPLLTINGAEEGYQAQDGGNRLHWAGTISYGLEGGGTTLMSNFDLLTLGDYSTIRRIHTSAKENLENGWESNSFWTGELGVDTAIVQGVAEHIAYPGRPYTLSHVNLVASVIAEAGAVVKAKLVSGKDGSFDYFNPVAEATYTFGAEAEEYANLTLDFTFQSVDPITGLPTTDPIVVNDGDMFIVIEWSDAKISYFIPYVYGVRSDFGKVHGWDDIRYSAYALVETGTVGDDGSFVSEGFQLGEAGGGYIWGNSSTGIYYLDSNFTISFDLTYPYLYTDDEAVIEVAAEGESKDLTINSNEGSDMFLVSGDELGETDAPEWINLEFTDGEEEYEGETYYDGTVAVVLTAEALPADLKGRTADVYITIPGQVLKLTVNQGEVEPEFAVGDVNGDGNVNGSDVTALYNYLLNGEPVKGNPNVDGDSDGAVNGADVTALYNILLQ